MPSCSNRWPVRSAWVGPLLLATACTAPEAFTGDGLGNGGSGGSVIAGSGGAIGSGGSLGSGGAAGSGGGSGTGGIGSGGVVGTGGRTGTGGSIGTGGVLGTGGTVGTGGATGTGGRAGTGGAVGSGGAIGTGGAGGGPSGTVLFSDDFETGNASQWITTMPTTDWSVVMDGATNVLKEGAAPSNVWRAAAAGTTAWTDIVVEAKVKILAFNGQSSTYLAGICARVQNATNYYCLGLRSDGKLAVRTTVAGSGANGPAVTVTGGIPLNAWHTLRFQVVGSALTGSLFLNGAATPTTMATQTDAMLTSGGIEVGTDNATAEFDDVRVTVP